MPRKSTIPEIATTSAQIRAAVERAIREDLSIELMCKPITDPCWRDEGAIVDADGALEPAILAAIVDGKPITGCPSTNWGKWHIGQDDDLLVFEVKHIASVRTLPAPTIVQIDGLEHDLVLHADGRATAGCQTLTPKGCEQAFRALAAHLGYDIED